MPTCDLIISADYLLPIAPANEVLRHHSVAINGEIITAIGPTPDIEQVWQASRHLKLDNHILLPGLVNAHGHAAMTLLRGAGEDQMLQDWLQKSMWPLEGKVMGNEYVALGTELAVAEMLLSGTTTFSDMYFMPEAAAEVVNQTGMRAQLAFPIIEFPNAWSESSEDAMHKGLALFQHYRHHSLINIALGPHSGYMLSDDDLVKVTMYADEIEAQVQIHMHENQAEVDEGVEKHGVSWIEHLQNLNALGPHLQMVHMTTLDERDLELTIGSGASVIHCPSSNQKLASGVCPVETLRNAGVRVGLGTDGAASNNTLDMFKEAHVAALLAKVTSLNAEHANARDTLYMATLGSASAMGLDTQIGSLEPGKAADLIAVNAAHPSLQPVIDPYATLIHGNCGHAVNHVFVNGKQLVDNGMLTQMDMGGLLSRVQAWQQDNLT